jgi:hypothetical protein
LQIGKSLGRETVIFPDTLTVTAIDLATGCPIPEVALLLELKAQRKNNYGVGPVITDKNGQARFTRKKCENDIAHAQQMFAIDYTGDLLSCGPLAEVHLHNPENIATMIHNFETSPKFWGSGLDEPEELYAALRKVRNSLYAPSTLAINENDILKQPAVNFCLRNR